MRIAIICYAECDVEIELTFLIKPFFLHDEKVMINS